MADNIIEVQKCKGCDALQRHLFCKDCQQFMKEEAESLGISFEAMMEKLEDTKKIVLVED